jgi:hypothetical protein
MNVRVRVRGQVNQLQVFLLRYQRGDHIGGKTLHRREAKPGIGGM